MKIACLRHQGGRDAFVEIDGMWIPVTEVSPGISGLTDTLQHLDEVEEQLAEYKAAGHGPNGDVTPGSVTASTRYGLSGAA